ncbi:type II secretion system protein [Thiomicrorhabdus xiamenensis]|uniref:Type II secretion system protein n=1 Tax=Thiomicrorhabdus xiamenensis TaxID=2739063 RepID=A0A7D4TDC9_9GAMM|nr:type II secretion system protein [Thiomicrorhabdus xiamenensis]QKI88547.1 type II secretion system protein [Thiomicrorhabdus xiamenensis]
MTKRNQGFSLVELSVALLILSLLTVFVAKVFKFDADATAPRKEARNQRALQESIDAYLRVNLYLPCPDIDGDGREDRQMLSGVSVCRAREGLLPFLDFNSPGTDAWGHSYYYRVHQRAQSAAYVNQACQPASVFGSQGVRGLEDLWLCPSSNNFYCADISGSSNCNDVCDEACTNTLDPRPQPFAHIDSSYLAPYFHLNTPPYGTRTGAFNLNVYDPNGVKVEEGVVAVVISWGANGDAVNSVSCGGVSSEELENCDSDRDFVYFPSGKGKDYLQWITVNQAKMALIKRHAFE